MEPTSPSNVVEWTHDSNWLVRQCVYRLGFGQFVDHWLDRAGCLTQPKRRLNLASELGRAR